MLEGPWQQLSYCRSNSGVLLQNISISCPRPMASALTLSMATVELTKSRDISWVRVTTLMSMVQNTAHIVSRTLSSCAVTRASALPDDDAVREAPASALLLT